VLRHPTALLSVTTPNPGPAWTFGSAEVSAEAGAKAPPEANVETQPSRGSRRRRLWELGRHAHCPVVGSCLPMAALRRLTHSLPGAAGAEDDFDLHRLAVDECGRRTALAEAVQLELERRYATAVRSAGQAKTTAALLAWWQAQANTHDLPGALWALLTHPRCDDTLEDSVLGQVHMLQHQVGMATRVELARFEALIDENAVLGRELAAAQQRNQQQASAHAQQLVALQAEAVRLRGQRLAALSEKQAFAEDLAALRASVPELAAREALAERCAQQQARVEQLQRALAQALAQAPAPTQASTAGQQSQPTAKPAHPTRAGAAPQTLHSNPPSLADQAVLCVGGRTASVPIYRRLIEACGGRFLHHDGGENEHVRRLDATLAAADLVICQTGCLSHEAYWRVKDHCKRTGKRCVFVEAPSAAHLKRALSNVSGVSKATSTSDGSCSTPHSTAG